MDNLYTSGINLIQAIQALGSWLLVPMRLFTALGDIYFFIIVAPAIYWCWDSKLGLRIGLMLMISGAVNDVAKVLIHAPRPSWIDPNVQVHAKEISFGLPSNHSQTAVVVWGNLAVWVRRTWMWVLALFVILMIGLSRLYLGVHFPTDVLAGWLLGALVLWGCLRLERPVIDWMNKKNLGIQFLAVFLFSMLMILVGMFARWLLRGYRLPAEWLHNAQQAYTEVGDFNPLATSGLFQVAAAFFGLAAGAILIKPRGGFNTSGPWWQRILRFLVGLAGVLIIYQGLGMIFPHGEDFIANILRYIRYGFIGLWVTGLAPLLFFALKLARPNQ
jgi:membrane-associated phospholipid phosphatase